MEEKIDLPEKGIVVGFELENLEDYLNCTEHLVQVHGKFEVLAEIEKKVNYHFRKYRERLLRFLFFFFQVQQKETTPIHLGPV